MSRTPKGARAARVEDPVHVLLESATAATEDVPGLAERHRQFRAMRDDGTGDELTVGVVGITSSGKSTFLNALMGENLLPEESRATTNTLVRCRRDSVRSATVVYEDGQERILAGPELTHQRLYELTSERFNPGNVKLAVEKGATSVLVPVTCRRQLADLSDDMATRVDMQFYSDARDALLKAVVE